jgi:hypothetical protein
MNSTASSKDKNLHIVEGGTHRGALETTSSWTLETELH